MGPKFPIYIAGSWTDRKEISKVIKDFEELDYEITHNWTKDSSENVEKKSIIDCRQCAVKDIQGVVNSKAVVVIMDNPKYAYRGTNNEIGCAIGLKIPVLIYNPLEVSYASTNVFYWHTGIERFNNIDSLITKLGKIRKEDEIFNSAMAIKISDSACKLNCQKQYKFIIKLIKDKCNKGLYSLEFKGDIYCTNELEQNGFEVVKKNDINDINEINWNKNVD